MTHNTVNTEPESGGSTEDVVHTIDITSLDSAGTEQYSPSDELGIQGADRWGVSVRGQADSSVQITWDHVNEQLDIVNVSDGTDVANNTAVGEVVLHATGV